MTQPLKIADLQLRQLAASIKVSELSETTDYDCSACQDRGIVLAERPNGTWTSYPCQCQEQRAIQRMLKVSGVQEQARNIRINNAQASAELRQAAKQYLDDLPSLMATNTVSKGMALQGTVGTGKTTVALALANELLDRRIPTVFIVTPELMAELRAAQFSDNKGELDRKLDLLSTADVVIFDDLARERITDWVREQYFRIIDRRYRGQMATVFTSNYGFEQLEGLLDAMTVSRLFALTRGRQVFVQGEDYRLRG